MQQRRDLRSFFAALFLESLLVDDAGALFDGYDRIHIRAVELVDDPTGPTNFNQIDLRALLQSEMQPLIALRDITVAAANFILLREVTGNNFHHRTNACSITLHSHELDQNGVV